MKCEESSILKTDNFYKNWNFQEIFKFFPLFQFKIMKILQNQTIICENNRELWEIILKKSILIGFYSQIYENLG